MVINIKKHFLIIIFRSVWSSGGHSSSNSSISASERLFGAPVPPAFGIGEHCPIPYEKGVVIGGSKVNMKTCFIN